jgi:IS30 family transposase
MWLCHESIYQAFTRRVDTAATHRGWLRTIAHRCVPGEITAALISAPNDVEEGLSTRCSRSINGPSRPRTGPNRGTGKGPFIGKDQGSAISTLVERQTRMVRLLHLPQRDGDTLHDALKSRMADLPAELLRSITWYQRTEVARHLTIAHSRCAPVYFGDSR